MLRPSSIYSFLIIIAFSLGVAFLIHIYLLGSMAYPVFDNKITLSYWINGTLASLIYSGLYLFRKRLKNQIGFLFIAGSFIKFILFFLLFYPSYRQDGKMDKLEFFAFFVPYLICLIVETIFTVKMLKKLDNESP